MYFVIFDNNIWPYLAGQINRRMLRFHLNGLGPRGDYLLCNNFKKGRTSVSNGSRFWWVERFEKWGKSCLTIGGFGSSAQARPDNGIDY